MAKIRGPREKPLKPDTGKFEPVKGSPRITLAQAHTREQIEERLAFARVYCDLAEKWLPDGPEQEPTHPPGPPPAGHHAKSAGVAKSCLRDALICLAEIWLGMDARSALELVRRMVAEASPKT